MFRTKNHGSCRILREQAANEGVHTCVRYMYVQKTIILYTFLSFPFSSLPLHSSKPMPACRHIIMSHVKFQLQVPDNYVKIYDNNT